MKPGGWLRGGLAVCLALCLWACTPASLTPEVTASPTAEPLPQASITPVPPTPVQPAPAVTAVPLITLALTAAPATPTANPDPNLLAQYAPWSLGHAAAWSPGGDVLAVSAGEVVYFYDRHSLQEQGQIDLGAWGAGLAGAVGALAAARRARETCSGEGRPYVDYWLGRLEFGVGYFDAVQSFRLAAKASQDGRKDHAIRDARTALDQARAALEAYARVAQDQSDRGAIATMAEYVYRPLRVKIEEDPSHPRFLQTVTGKGYRFNPGGEP